MDPRQKQHILAYLLLTLALLVLLALGLLAGSTRIPTGEVLTALFKPAQGGMSAGIVRNIRLPRALAAVLLGGALSVAGFLLQTFFSNPIAGPFILGISSGAKLVLSLTLIAFLSRGIAAGSLTLIAAAFAGAMLSMGFVLAISSRVRSMSLLIICGVMIGYVCSAVTDFVVTFADDADIVNLHHWSLGSFSGISWDNVAAIAAVTLPALLFAFLLSKPMDAYRLGETYARNMGVNVRAFRAALIALSGVLSASVAAFAGPVSFVGVAVPHITKLLFGTSKPIVVIPGSFLLGGAFCMGCDLLARTLFSPTELAISTVTAVFGAPVVIALMVSRQRSKADG